LGSDQKLAEVLSEFARTMLTDFSIEGILDRLVERIVDVMPVSGAGVTLMSPEGVPRYVAASDGTAMGFERLQFDLGEGPCMDVYKSGLAVCVPNLGKETRFPKFTQGALESGLVAVFAFPLRHGNSQLGALDLYRHTHGPLATASLKSAQTLADVAAAYLLNATTRSDLEASRKEALHDPLTGLANRVLLFEFLDQALLRAGRSGGDLAVLFCDLDRFKWINDNFGHQVGDELLVAVAEGLAGLIRPSDTLARLAGDEFVIVCEGLNGDAEAKMIAQRVIDSFATPFLLSVGQVDVAVSVGIALGGVSTIASRDLINDADRAMYQAKKRGGAQCWVVDSASKRPSGEEQALIERLLLSAQKRARRLRSVAVLTDPTRRS
jgi:diguanylate cyclase (GGDEF)-like protein